MKQFSYTEKTYPARTRSKRSREDGLSASAGSGNLVRTAMDGSPGITEHGELSGILSTANEYSEFATDIHLTAADADKLKGFPDLGIIPSTDEDTIPTDENIYTALKAKLEDEKVRQEMEKKYIRKDKADETGFRVDFHDGITAGRYTGGFLGDGAMIDKDGNAEMTSLRLRDFLEVPELRFNRIDVVSGELWNAVAFGLIESVDTKNKIVALKLEDGELSGLHINDFCRGIFHNLIGNEATSGTDSAGFETIAGFSTSYFTPVEIIDNAHFRYELKPGTSVHPTPSMKFAVYGNATDKTRQASAYSTRTYKRYLINVDTWEINPEKNVTYQDGDLSNLVINGQPLEGGSVYLNNVYFGDKILSVPGLDNSLKGDDAYSVVLSSYSTVFNTDSSMYQEVQVVAGNANVVTGSDLVVTTEFNITTRIQAAKGAQMLRYSNVIGEGKYVVVSEGVNCEYVITDGLVAVKSVTGENAEIRLHVNCEGVSTFDLVFTITGVKDGEAGADGKPGENGKPGNDGNTILPVYRSSETVPAKPTGYSVPPSGWSLDPPTSSSPVWMSKTTINSNGVSISGVWSNPIRITGQNGQDGKTGPVMTFRGEYSDSKTYISSDQHVDAVYTVNGSVKTFWIAKPGVGVIINKPPYSGSPYWDLFQGEFQSLATGLALIEKANIAGWWFSDLIIESQNGNVILNGVADDLPKFAAGSPRDGTLKKRLEDALFKVYDSGKFVATYGKIGPFEIGGLNGYQFVAGDYNNGNGDYLRLSGNVLEARSNSDAGRYASMWMSPYVAGTYSDPPPVASFTNKYFDENTSYAKGVEIVVKGAKNNVALQTTGGVSHINSVFEIDPSKGAYSDEIQRNFRMFNHFFINNQKSNHLFYLPSVGYTDGNQTYADLDRGESESVILEIVISHVTSYRCVLSVRGNDTYLKNEKGNIIAED